eukprot:scaffold229053_cov32-Tisochrysis_lutea.AAC.3
MEPTSSWPIRGRTNFSNASSCSVLLRGERRAHASRCAYTSPSARPSTDESSQSLMPKASTSATASGRSMRNNRSIAARMSAAARGLIQPLSRSEGTACRASSLAA